VPVYLQPDVELSVRADSVVLERRDVPVSHVLGVAEAVALACLGATGEECSASRICDELFEQGSRWVQRVVNRYWTYFGDGPARDLNRAWLEHVAGLRPTFPILPLSSVKQEAAPASITWMVTLGCNRKCPYCFFDVYNFSGDSADSPPDATFPLNDAVRMVREMARIGAADLYLTGGEPLLRKDLPEVIEEASRVRVRVHLVTKYAVSQALAARLAAAGITSVIVSLDDARPQAAAALAGAPGYLGEARKTIQAMIAAGIPVEVNTVVTKVNTGHLRELAVYLADLGVPKLKFSPFHEPYPQRAPAAKLATAEVDEGRFAAMKEEFESRNLEIAIGSGASPSASEPCGSLICEIGTRALDVMPDGSVSRCHYLTHRSEMIVGSLRDQSLLEIWRGPSLASVVRPTRSSFEATTCFSCEEHDGCNSRGRCYVSSLQTSGRLYAQDAFCIRQ
jgi:MoaA/NifB/PqqE/SkfB family radical SAM enzyme